MNASSKITANDKLGTFPPELAAIQQASRADEKAMKALNTVAERLKLAQVGQRNDQLNKACFFMGQMVASGRLTMQIVQDRLWNSASAIGISRYEFENTFQSGFEAGRAYPIPEDDYAYKENYYQPLATQSTLKNSELQLFDHVLDINLEPPKWLIDGLVPEYAMAAIVGPSYTGKSYLAVDLACSVSTGYKWQSEFDVVSGNVFYVIGEGRFGIRRRVEAWHRNRGVPIERETTNLHFSRQGLNFRDKNSIAAIKADMHLVGNIKLIVIDTLARSFGGGNENAPQDMGEFINNCDELMHEFEATVLIIHHTGKDTQAGARGHSSFFSALDTSMTLKKLSQHDILLHCDKQKDAPEFDDIQFCFVSLNSDDDTPVIQRVETTARRREIKLGINEQLAMDTFSEATIGKPIQCRLHLDEWRPFFERRHTGDTDKAKNDAFSRARRDLVSKGFLTADNDYYALGDKATFGDNQGNVAGQNHSEGDATDTPL